MDGLWYTVQGMIEILLFKFYLHKNPHQLKKIKNKQKRVSMARTPPNPKLASAFDEYESI